MLKSLINNESDIYILYVITLLFTYTMIPCQPPLGDQERGQYKTNIPAKSKHPKVLKTKEMAYRVFQNVENGQNRGYLPREPTALSCVKTMA